MIQNIYGVVDFNNTHTDISTSLHATKIYATKNGYANISCRSNGGYNAPIVYTKIKNKWVEI